MRLSDQNLFVKLSLPLVCVVLGTCAIIAVALGGLGQIRDRVTDLAQISAPRVIAALETIGALHEASAQSGLTILATSKDDIQALSLIHI